MTVITKSNSNNKKRKSRWRRYIDVRTHKSNTQTHAHINSRENTRKQRKGKENKKKRGAAVEGGGGRKKKGAFLIASSSPPAPATPHLFTAGLRHFTEKKDLTNENVRKMKLKKKRAVQTSKTYTSSQKKKRRTECQRTSKQQ